VINAQVYCTEQELIDDLGLNGRETRLYDRILAASAFIAKRIGQFIPTSETRGFQGEGAESLYVDPLLAITSVSNNSTAVTDYDAFPVNRYWTNGPYTRLISESIDWDVVDVAGSWGKYSESTSVSTETVTQLSGDTTLVLANGANASPGMVLLVGSEQELVTGWGAASAAVSQLNGAIDDAQEEIVVDNGAEFHEGEVIQLSTEDVFVRKIRTNTLVVARGWNGTTKASHLDNAAIAVCRTVNVTRGINGTTAVAHNTVALQRYLVPQDVNWLCREMAGLMHKKAQSGFAGRVGNAETGESFYYNEFPGQIKEVARNYRITSL
jgi:hypothetical protein